MLGRVAAYGVVPGAFLTNLDRKMQEALRRESAPAGEQRRRKARRRRRSCLHMCGALPAVTAACTARCISVALQGLCQLTLHRNLQVATEGSGACPSTNVTPAAPAPVAADPDSEVGGLLP